MALPQVLGSGYGWVQPATAKDTLTAIPLWIVLLLPVAKIIATSLSIGTGGSGGIFGPGIVIGAFVGAATWRLGDLLHLPGIPDSPGIFVVVGMMACFGSIAHAPLPLLIMVAEMTGSFSVVPGAIIAVGIASLLLYHTKSVDLPRAAPQPGNRCSRTRKSGRRPIGQRPRLLTCNEIQPRAALAASFSVEVPAFTS